MAVLLIASPAVIVTHGDVARCRGAGAEAPARPARAIRAGPGHLGDGRRSRRRPSSRRSAPARGRRARQRRAATRPGALARANSPTTVGPEPLTNASSAPASRALRSAAAISGHSEIGRVLQVVLQAALHRAGSGAPSSSAARRRSRQRVELWLPRGHGRAGRPRRRPRRSTAPRASGSTSSPSGRARVRQPLQALAGAAGKPAPGRDLRGDVGAQLRAELAQQLLIAEPRGARGQAQRGGRVGRAAPQPRRDGNPLEDASAAAAGASQPVLARKARSAAAARFSCAGPATPGQTTSSPRRRPAARLERQLVGQRDRLHHRDELVPARPAARVGPRNSPRLTFAGASAR